MGSPPGRSSFVPPIFHHCLPVSQVSNDTIRPDRSLSSPEFLAAYEWLEQEVGFFPIFIAVGISDDVIQMTGYADNWRILTGCEEQDGSWAKIYRKKGEFPSLALFSFSQIEGVFMDYQAWHIALNACLNDHSVSPSEKRMIFKPSWPAGRWVRAALHGTHLVQLVTPALTLSDAVRVRVRNTSVMHHLSARGFSNISVARIPVTSW